ncbi:MAG: hypothetical protein MI919_30820, partial [Holophagales bacterium]|nr:hypothetical protein [Holophagales bacterium]
MKRVFVLLAVIGAHLSSGCGEHNDQMAPDSYRVTVKEIVETSHLLVKQVVIEAAGTRTVRIEDKGGNTDLAATEPERTTGLSRAEVTFVAFLEPASESASTFWWKTQIKGQGTTAFRGPSAYPAEAESLTDVLELELEPGLHLLG